MTAAPGAAPARADIALAAVADTFALSPVERDVLGLLVEMATGRNQLRVRGGAVRVGDVVELLGARHPAVGDVIAALWPSSTLVRRGLVELRGDGPRLDRTIAIGDDVWPRLAGTWPAGVPRARPVGTDHLAELVLPAAVRDRAAALVAWMRSGTSAWPVIVVVGTPGSGRRAIAEAMLGAIGLPVLELDGRGLAASHVALWAREATWQQAAVVIAGADEAPGDALAALLDEVEAPVVVTTRSAGLEAVVGVRAARRLVLPELDDDTRAGVWRRHLATAGLAADAVDVPRIAARFPFSAGRIETVARALAAESTSPSTAEVTALCRALATAELGGLAEVVEQPYAWDDLVIPAPVRRELELMITWASRGRELFGERGPGRRLSAGRGLACLFHGPPGTGKTMAAQVIARALDVDLLRVDLSRVVDKYIGETEKRLDRLFDEAQAAGALLFFDEADALFGTRTDVRDARDRYANLETGYLLQRLELHRGLTILATNLQRNLDPAFLRRLAIVAEFTVPEVAQRRMLWERLLPPADERAADVDVELLATRMPLAGGNIRNAILTAVMLAAREHERLAMKHLVVAVWRELAKAGRFLAEHELGPWHRVVAAYVAGGAVG